MSDYDLARQRIAALAVHYADVARQNLRDGVPPIIRGFDDGKYDGFKECLAILDDIAAKR